jgi:hypothetical protein
VRGKVSVWMSWLVGGISAALSAYGWWFHFDVGPAHGPGKELGLIAGVVSLLSFALGWRLNITRRASSTRPSQSTQDLGR